jgi:hypothetical protein
MTLGSGLAPDIAALRRGDHAAVRADALAGLTVAAYRERTEAA